jgi:hypothetical protein
MRSWYDSSSGRFDSTKVIYGRKWSMSSSLGGHDIMANFEYAMRNAGNGETSHAGFPVMWYADLLADLKALNIPVGEHVMALKQGHSGADSDSDASSSLKFTIDSGYSGFSNVNYMYTGTDYNGGSYDIAFCACEIGKDCPGANPPTAPGVMPPWYAITTGGEMSSPGTDKGARMLPVYMGKSIPYSYPTYKKFCNDMGLLVWHDEGSPNGQTEYNGALYDQNLGSVNLGGHDAVTGLSAGLQDSGDSGHGGWPLVTVADALVHLKRAGVPVGSHKLALKYAHSGQTSSSSSGSFVDFTINSGYSAISSVSGHHAQGAGTSYDIAMCACLYPKCPEM